MYTIVPRRGNRGLSRNNDTLSNFFDDRFFRSFFDMSDCMSTVGFRVDVKEKPDHYAMEAELPGVKEENINLVVDEDVLTISADMNTHKQEEKENYLYSERRSGHMERKFNLDGICQDTITAKFENGVLSITLPKAKPEAQKTARKIAIGSGE